MILYLGIIGVAVLCIAAAAAVFSSETFLVTLGWTVFATIAVMLVDGVTAAICRLLPQAFVDPAKRVFHVSAREKQFYEKLKIRKWKDKVPEIGHFTGFRKNKLECSMCI